MKKYLPRLSWRFISVWQRNFLVWKKLIVVSLMFNVVEPLITLIALGYGVGGFIHSIDGKPYIYYLASGVIAMSVMMSASFEALYSAFSRMFVQKTWDTILNTPLQLDDVVLAEMLWAATKAMFSALAIFVVVLLLGFSFQWTMLLAFPILLLAAMSFASMGLTINAFAKGYDFFSYYITLVQTPMIFISGIYYPINRLPHFLQLIAELTPLSALVYLVRPLMLGQWPAQWIFPLSVILAYGVIFFCAAVLLTRKRFKVF